MNHTSKDSNNSSVSVSWIIISMILVLYEAVKLIEQAIFMIYKTIELPFLYLKWLIDVQSNNSSPKALDSNAASNKKIALDLICNIAAPDNSLIIKTSKTVLNDSVTSETVLNDSTSSEVALYDSTPEKEISIAFDDVATCMKLDKVKTAIPDSLVFSSLYGHLANCSNGENLGTGIETRSDYSDEVTFLHDKPKSPDPEPESPNAKLEYLNAELESPHIELENALCLSENRVSLTSAGTLQKFSSVVSSLESNKVASSNCYSGFSIPLKDEPSVRQPVTESDAESSNVIASATTLCQNNKYKVSDTDDMTMEACEVQEDSENVNKAPGNLNTDVVDDVDILVANTCSTKCAKEKVCETLEVDNISGKSYDLHDDKIKFESLHDTADAPAKPSCSTTPLTTKSVITKSTQTAAIQSLEISTMPPSLCNQKGLLCTVLGQKYIFTFIEETPILVFVKAEEKFRDRVAAPFFSSILNAVYTSHGFALIQYLPDGFEVLFDAVCIPNTKGYLAVFIWNEVKPYHTAIPCPNTFGYIESYANLPAKIMLKDSNLLYIDVQIGFTMQKAVFPIESFNRDNAHITNEIIKFPGLHLLPLVADVSKFYNFTAELSCPLYVCLSLQVPATNCRKTLTHVNFNHQKIYTIDRYHQPMESSSHIMFCDVDIYIFCENEYLVLKAFVSNKYTEIEAKLRRKVNGKKIKIFSDKKFAKGDIHRLVTPENKPEWTLMMIYSSVDNWINSIQNVKMYEVGTEEENDKRTKKNEVAKIRKSLEMKDEDDVSDHLSVDSGFSLNEMAIMNESQQIDSSHEQRNLPAPFSLQSINDLQTRKASVSHLVLEPDIPHYTDKQGSIVLDKVSVEKKLTDGKTKIEHALFTEDSKKIQEQFSLDIHNLNLASDATRNISSDTSSNAKIHGACKYQKKADTVSTADSNSTASEDFIDNYYKLYTSSSISEPDRNSNSEKVYPVATISMVDEVSLTLGDNLVVTRENCFLFGLSLQSYSLQKLLKRDQSVEYQLESGLKDPCQCWIGGPPQKTPEETYHQVESWCRQYSVPMDIMCSLLEQVPWVPDSLSPIYEKKVMEIVSLTT